LTKQLKSATINQVIDILKGSKQRAIKDAGYDQLEQFNIAEEVSRTSKSNISV
jgi:superfamily II DNA helicase RecQ